MKACIPSCAGGGLLRHTPTAFWDGADQSKRRKSGSCGRLAHSDTRGTNNDTRAAATLHLQGLCCSRKRFVCGGGGASMWASAMTTRRSSRRTCVAMSYPAGRNQITRRAGLGGAAVHPYFNDDFRYIRFG
jgi:hypothetical protein